MASPTAFIMIVFFIRCKITMQYLLFMVYNFSKLPYHLRKLYILDLWNWLKGGQL